MFTLSNATFGSSNATFGLSNATLGLIRPSLISNKISTYIKDTTGEDVAPYKVNSFTWSATTQEVNANITISSSYIGSETDLTTDLTTDSYNYNGNTYNFFTLLPFVSLISFLAGYKLSICLRN